MRKKRIDVNGPKNNLNIKATKLSREIEKTELTLRYKQVLYDAKLFEQGKLKTYPISELLKNLF